LSFSFPLYLLTSRSTACMSQSNSGAALCHTSPDAVLTESHVTSLCNSSSSMLIWYSDARSLLHGKITSSFYRDDACFSCKPCGAKRFWMTCCFSCLFMVFGLDPDPDPDPGLHGPTSLCTSRHHSPHHVLRTEVLDRMPSGRPWPFHLFKISTRLPVLVHHIIDPSQYHPFPPFPPQPSSANLPIPSIYSRGFPPRPALSHAMPCHGLSTSLPITSHHHSPSTPP
jgi:hypothetical protein